MIALAISPPTTRRRYGRLLRGTFAHLGVEFFQRGAAAAERQRFRVGCLDGKSQLVHSGDIRAGQRRPDRPRGDTGFRQGRCSP